jgi:GcrA cell cycle regulator
MKIEKWPEEHKALALAMNAEGHTFTEISKTLKSRFDADYSRSAVIGKVYRLLGSDLAKPAKPARPRKVVDVVDEAPIAILPVKSPYDYNKRPRRGSPKAPKDHAILCRVSDKISQTPLDISRFETQPSDVAQVVAFGDLKRNQCHWPIGTPGHKDFGYCGQRTDTRGGYCADHGAKAYEKPSKPRTANRAFKRVRDFEGRLRDVQY